VESGKGRIVFNRFLRSLRSVEMTNFRLVNFFRWVEIAVPARRDYAGLAMTWGRAEKRGQSAVKGTPTEGGGLNETESSGEARACFLLLII
jgi:hypothetical protein